MLLLSNPGFINYIHPIINKQSESKHNKNNIKNRKGLSQNHCVTFFSNSESLNFRECQRVGKSENKLVVLRQPSLLLSN
jgi:hypothetical protein